MSKMLDVTNPYTGELVESIKLDTVEELKEKVAKAKAAQPAWERTPIVQRAKLIMAMIDKIEEKNEEIGTICAKEMAKPINSAKGECFDGGEIGRGNVERAKHLYGDVFTGTTGGREYDLGFCRREALGVVAAIIPFNYPIEMFFQKTTPALAMGNTVIVKAPSSNPLAVRMLVECAHEVGIPEDVIQFTACERSVSTEALLTHPDVAAIALTGSTETGVEMIKLAADSMKKTFMELGGNDALIICDDADVDTAVQEALEGRLYNNGQICCATKRYLVPESMHDEFVEKLKEKVLAIPRGDQFDPDAKAICLVTEKAAIKVEAQIKHTVEQGGTIVCGGKREGAFIEPTIIDNVSKDADVAKDMEIFAQVWPIITYKTEEEAIEIANQSSYGLSGGVLAGDTVRAFRIADQMESSAVIVNGCSCYRMNEQPFGGCKASGLGNEGVGYSPEEYSRLKTYVLKGAFVK